MNVVLKQSSFLGYKSIVRLTLCLVLPMKSYAKQVLNHGQSTLDVNREITVFLFPHLSHIKKLKLFQNRISAVSMHSRIFDLSLFWYLSVQLKYIKYLFIAI